MGLDTKESGSTSLPNIYLKAPHSTTNDSTRHITSYGRLARYNEAVCTRAFKSLAWSVRSPLKARKVGEIDIQVKSGPKLI